MKLSWLNTSEAHTNNTSIYMIWQYEQMHKVIERERELRESGSIANTQICFKVQAHSSTSPPLHRRIFTNSSTQDFPHRELPLRILGNTITGSTQLLSQIQHNLYTQRLGTKLLKHNHLTLEGFQHNLHLSQEGAKYHFHYHLTLEG